MSATPQDPIQALGKAVATLTGAMRALVNELSESNQIDRARLLARFDELATGPESKEHMSIAFLNFIVEDLRHGPGK